MNINNEVLISIPSPTWTQDKREEAISSDAIQKYHDVRYQHNMPFLRNTNRGIKNPLKLLCLHGQGTNNDITKIQLSRIGLFQKVELDLIHGKYKSDPGVPGFLKLSKEPFYDWWDKP